MVSRSSKDTFCSAVKRETGGMLPVQVYGAVYQEIFNLPDLPFVEIGAASGTCSIVIAQALIDSKKISNVVSIEKCRGGSRDQFCSYDDNLCILNENLKMFHVEERVLLYPHSMTHKLSDELRDKIGSDQISGFMHDADGRLDRDFSVLWNRVIPGGLIIIDDFEDKIISLKSTNDSVEIDIKKVLTYHLLNLLIEEGFFEPMFQIHNTVFGRKPYNISTDIFPFSKLQNTVNIMLDGRNEVLLRCEN